MIFLVGVLIYGFLAVAASGQLLQTSLSIPAFEVWGAIFFIFGFGVFFGMALIKAEKI
jgi:hypothetical protein